MKNARTLALCAAAAALCALPALSQSIPPGLPDPYRLTEPKNFAAFRASSSQATSRAIGSGPRSASVRPPGSRAWTSLTRGPWG